MGAFFKWLDVFELGSSATATTTIQHLLRFIANFGLPRVLVSDNGPQFLSNEFRQFCVSNGTDHQRTPPYHAASNGQCERMVQELKVKARPPSVSISVQLSQFLFQNRTTPHSTTHQSPASLLFKRQPTACLLWLVSSFARATQHRHSVNDINLHDSLQAATTFTFLTHALGVSRSGSREQLLIASVR